MAELLRGRAVRLPAAALALVLTACGSIDGADVPDAGEIALAADAAPPGMSFDGTGEGESALTEVVASGRDAEFRALAGLVDGHFRTFSGESGAVLSLALVFDDASDADAALSLYLDELESEDGYGLDGGEAADWGDEGVCASGPVATPIGEETICVWRTGPVVMALGGSMDLEQFEDIAAGMDVRAAPGG
jgi:hypothetical protein